MKIMVIDGNSIINRAFYGIRALSAPDGTPTNAIFGFLTILNKLLAEEKPDAVAVCFDLKAPTFRHEKYAEYKATRKKMPEELAVQLPILKEVLDEMGIPRLEREGLEADDLIGSLTKRQSENGNSCVIVTGDKDSFQLISGQVTVKYVKSHMGKTETIDYTPARFIEEYGFQPVNIIDFKALMGDSSDNIPGVPGIGEKTALELIRRFGTIDEIYRNINEIDIRDSMRAKLLEGEESARDSYELATIVTDAEVDITIKKLERGDVYGNGALAIFERLGFFSLIEKWGLRKNAQEDAKANNTESAEAREAPVIPIGIEAALKLVKTAGKIAVLPSDDFLEMEISDGESAFLLRQIENHEDYARLLNAVFSQETRKIAHNVKDIMRWLKENGLDAGGFVFDTALAAYLLQPTESGYDIERLAQRHLGLSTGGATAIFALETQLKKRLADDGLMEVYEKIELPLCGVLADMEIAGFLVDRRALIDFGAGLKVTIAALERDIYRLAGNEFNINSPKQLGTVLFERLMLPAGKKLKTGWSTNAEVLEKLRGKHEIIGSILDYRQLTKLKSSYSEGLLKTLSPDGRIHTSFQMTVTATGRLSSTEPNLQNIPVRTELGAEIRKMFVAAPGKILVDADYSQIELRLLAHISGDETMITAFINGEDIHAVTASQVFGVPQGEVTPQMRSRAKAVNFGIVYGISAFSLSQDIGVTISEAKEYINAYLEKYHGVREYMKSVVERAKKDGYVTTLFGRRRALPELRNVNHNVRAFGERIALNAPIQGTAADIIKIAMIRAAHRLKSEGLDSRLILQVHDELIAECPEHEADRAAIILTEEMQGAAELRVPLIAAAKRGKSWSLAK